MAIKILERKIYEYNTVFKKYDGYYVVTVPSLPGLVTEGNTLTEAVYMAKDAIKCYLEAILKDKVLQSVRKNKTQRRIKISRIPKLHYA